MLARINRNYVPAYWDDFFNDNFFNGFRSVNQKNTSPAVNVVEEDDSFRIEVAVPGMSRKDIRIDLEDQVLTISSEHKDEKEDKKGQYMRREFNYSAFKRSFELPETVNADQIRAKHNEGVLTIELPKKEEVVSKAPKQIEIK